MKTAKEDVRSSLQPTVGKEKVEGSREGRKDSILGDKRGEEGIQGSVTIPVTD